VLPSWTERYVLWCNYREKETDLQLVIWFRMGISGGLCEYSAGICEHGTGTVAEFVNTVLDQWRTM
jgi:hypothetical protein